MGSVAEALAGGHPRPADDSYRLGLAPTQVIDRPIGRPPPPREDLAVRVMDLAVALLALIAFAPLLCVIVLLIKMRDPGPVLFAHHRIGQGGRAFRCWKFRTMVVDAEARLNGLLATDPAAWAEWQRDRKLRRDPRVTSIGRFLRQTSLDELPQLFNIILGDMSIVGPRPIVASEVPLYGVAFRRYCSVRPGITGLWQASGRNDVAYRRRVAMDVIYARKRSLAFNVQIIALTVPAVVFGKGSY